ncbi:MAG: primosomal protein N' [Pseudomonadota bacterium]
MARLTLILVQCAVAVETAYTYRLEDGRYLEPGTIVSVPLGNRTVLGAVWPGEADAIDPAKLKDIERVHGCPPLTPEMIRFVEWIADYYVSPRGLVLNAVLRSEDALAPADPVMALRATGVVPERMTPSRERVLALTSDGFARTRRLLADEASVSLAVINGLVDQGALDYVATPPPPIVHPPDPDHGQPNLNPNQQDAVTGLPRVADGHAVALLDGVTGSGKTEVYFEAIADALHAGRQALILLPEIALTEAFLKRFEARFSARPAEWHSDVGAKRRAAIWRGVSEGTVQVVAGARSALFLPFSSLGVIIVDEEHDQAYKQDERVPYQARDMAVLRGHIEGVPVILSSATPSVESWANAERARYRHLRLPERHGGHALPDIDLVDLTQTPPEPQRFLSDPLVAAVGETLEKGEQSLLFLNRRGYAPLTLCRACGFRFECANCSAWLVEHRFRRVLLCHHCGVTQPIPPRCPNCDAEDSLVPCGPGIERIAEETAERFPDARITILSSDLIPGVRVMRERLSLIAKGEADIVIGTQLAAKGHHFPLMTLIGVVDADAGLASVDPRSGERAFQLLEQVIGRAGRERSGARALMQTYQPSHPVLQALVARDRDAFYAREMAAREEAGMPPFARLAGLIVSARDKTTTEAHARAMVRAAPATDRARILGPVEAPMVLIRGRFRYRLLVKADRSFDLPAYIRAWLDVAPKERGGVRVQIDIDPQSFL